MERLPIRHIPVVSGYADQWFGEGRTPPADLIGLFEGGVDADGRFMTRDGAVRNAHALLIEVEMFWPPGLPGSRVLIADDPDEEAVPFMAAIEDDRGRVHALHDCTPVIPGRYAFGAVFGGGPEALFFPLDPGTGGEHAPGPATLITVTRTCTEDIERSGRPSRGEPVVGEFRLTEEPRPRALSLIRRSEPAPSELRALREAFLALRGAS